MARGSRAQAAEAQQSDAVEKAPAVEAAPLDPREIDFERYVNDLNAYRENGGPRPVAHAVVVTTPAELAESKA